MRYLAAAVIAIVVLSIVLDNSQRIDVGYVFGERRAPLWFVMLAAGVAGAAVAWLAKHRPRRHR